MLMTSSYGVEILKLNKPLKRTMQAAREAVKWLLPVIGKEWAEGCAEEDRHGLPEEVLDGKEGKGACPG